MLNADEIEQIIPHRYPFLFVDRIIEIEEGRRAVGIKNVTANEWFFEGHFPGKKVMPGVLIVEALAQVAAVALLKGVAMAGKSPLFGGIENMRFRKPVLPGDHSAESPWKTARPVGRACPRHRGRQLRPGPISFAWSTSRGTALNAARLPAHYPPRLSDRPICVLQLIHRY